MYEVPDPVQVKGRIELNAWDGILLLVHARRECVVPLFSKTPQQSDYSAVWHSSDETNKPVDSAADAGLISKVETEEPAGWKRRMIESVKQSQPWAVRMKKHQFLNSVPAWSRALLSPNSSKDERFLGRIAAGEIQAGPITRRAVVVTAVRPR